MAAEQKLEMLAKEIVSKTTCPKTDLKKTEKSEKKKMNLTVLLLFVLCMSFLGAGTLLYYFSNRNPAFDALQNDGFVAVINEKQKKDGVTLTVEAAVTDGAKTYIRIRAEGLPKDQPVTKQLADAYLVNEEGMRLEYQNVPLYTYKDTRIVDAAPVLDADHLDENEVVMMFYGAPAAKGEGRFSVHLSFEGVNGEFSVENLTLKVPEVVARDVADLNLRIKLPYGEGKIERVVFTKLETYFDIQWFLNETSEETLVESLEQDTGIYKNGEKTAEYEVPHPLLQAVQDSAAASQYMIRDQFIVPAAFDPNKPLLIEKKDKKGGPAEELVRIP